MFASFIISQNKNSRIYISVNLTDIRKEQNEEDEEAEEKKKKILQK